MPRNGNKKTPKDAYVSQVLATKTDSQSQSQSQSDFDSQKTDIIGDESDATVLIKEEDDDDAKTQYKAKDGRIKKRYRPGWFNLFTLNVL